MNQSTCCPAAPRASLFRRHCDAIGRAAELAGEELQQQPGTSGRSRRRSDLTLLLPQQDLTSLVVPLPLLLSSVLTPSNLVGSVPPAPLRRPYALKVLYRNHDDALRQQITREITILRTVEHPAVVRCHGMYEQANEPQILLEYMDGGFLKGRRISSKAFLADVTHQVLCGIAYLHRRHIVHNDIKPSNLLIDSEHRVKISDFGIGHILNQTMDPYNSSVGTIAYMSPERINTDLNDGAYDGYAGDIWSFGLSILEFNMGITVISKFLSPLFV